MKVLVAVKRVLDEELPVELIEGTSEINTSHQRMIINPFDEIAIEEAMKLKDRGVADEVIVVTCGSGECGKMLRKALAFGADKAIHVNTDEDLQSFATSSLLAALARRESADLILCGRQATDTGTAETPAMTAGMLNWSQATIASNLVIEGSNVLAICEIDGGVERVALTLPAVVSVALEMNTPRPLGLSACVEANKKPIEVITPKDLGVDASPRLKVLSVEAPPTRKEPLRVRTVDELIERLREEKVL